MVAKQARAGDHGRMPHRSWWRAALVLGLAFAMSGCVGSSAGPGGEGRAAARLTVLAAASLRGPIEAAARQFEASHPGVIVRLSFASSTALRVQIEQGAPADAFLAADLANPEALIASGLAAGPPTIVARNALAIVVPADVEPGSPRDLATPRDLALPGLKIIAAGDAVPITVYARQLLGNLAAVPGYPVGYREAVLGNIVSREDDVRAVLAKVELGEGDAGIVYASDAFGSSLVRAIAIPDGANVAVAYGGVVIRDAERPAEAAAFLAWLSGPAGQEVLAVHGFGAAP